MNIIYFNTTEKEPSGGAKIIYRHSDIINNLGINEITNAAWNLLIQIPVNKTLLNQIRTLSSI
jgi:hypothetical protein